MLQGDESLIFKSYAHKSAARISEDLTSQHKKFFGKSGFQKGVELFRKHVL